MTPPATTTMSTPSDLDLALHDPPTTTPTSAVAVAHAENNELLLVQGLHSLGEYGCTKFWAAAKHVLFRLLSSASDPHSPRPLLRPLKKKNVLHLRHSRIISIPTTSTSSSPPLSPYQDDGPSSSPFPRRARTPSSSRHSYYYGASSPPRPRIFPSTPSTPPRANRPASPSGARPRNTTTNNSSLLPPLSPIDEPASSPFPRTRSHISLPSSPRHHTADPLSSTFPRTRVLQSPRYYETTTTLSSSPFTKPGTRYHSSRPYPYSSSPHRQARTTYSPQLSPRNSLLNRRLARSSHSRNIGAAPLQIDVNNDPQHNVRFDNVVKVAYI